MSQINNITYLPKIRPLAWSNDVEARRYLADLELWAKQVYENLTGVHRVSAYTVANLPTASDFDPANGEGAALIYVSDETGGATLAFSDGANWRRVQDRAVVS